jgi:LmbE family N-acetylglucosaminyl deacetylase
MAQQAARLAGVPHLAYPVWGWTLPPAHPLPAEPVAGWRFDIAAFLPAKRAAIAAHASQHGEVVRDDPEGFRLPQEFLALFDRPFEVFLAA